MAQEQQINYLKIGSFVVAGLFLAVIVILLFGARTWFQKSVYVETYFNESVQGLSIGSPVKYLGMDIGTVKKITPADNIYHIYRHDFQTPHDRYVYVLMEIKPDFFKSGSRHQLTKTITEDIAAGLRVRLTLQNVTGSVFLELDFLDPSKNPVLPIHWTPKNYYIPSIPSAITTFKDRVSVIFGELKEVNFKKLADSMQKLANSATGVANRMNRLLDQTSEQLKDSINNLHNVSENLNVLAEQTKDFPSYTLFGKAPPKLDPNKL